MMKKVNPSAPKRGARAVLVDGQGRLRTGWLLAASLAAAAALYAAGNLGLPVLFSKMLTGWGVNAQTASLAPGWARAFYVWNGSLATALFALALLAVCAPLRRMWGMRDGLLNAKGLRRGALAALGTALALAISAGVFLLVDSLRAEWPLARPAFSLAGTVLTLAALLSALAGDAFTKRVLYDGVHSRWGGAWAAVISAIVFFAANGGLSGGVLSGVNVALLGLALAALYSRFGLWVSVGARWAWHAVNTFVLGFGAGGYGLYRLYGVSEVWLTGGDGGFISGGWATFLLLAALAILLRAPIWKAARRLFHREKAETPSQPVKMERKKR